MRWTRFALDPDSPCQFEEVPCPGCGAFLVVHAPDPHAPERMLGVCGECHAWYLMHYEEGKMMRLPDGPGAAGRTRGRRGTESPQR
jgi:hypothetical protein